METTLVAPPSASPEYAAASREAPSAKWARIGGPRRSTPRTRPTSPQERALAEWAQRGKKLGDTVVKEAARIADVSADDERLNYHVAVKHVLIAARGQINKALRNENTFATIRTARRRLLILGVIGVVVAALGGGLAHWGARSGAEIRAKEAL